MTSRLTAQNKADDVVGTWLTGGENAARIEIFRMGEKYFGKVVWLQNPNMNGKPKIDFNNPDINLRNKPRLGLQILKDFKFDGDDEWQGGEVYDPQSGKSYSTFLYMKDRNTLRLRGYIGFSVFGKTVTWTRTN